MLFRSWLAGRDRHLAADPTDFAPLMAAYRDRLRAVIAAAGPRAITAALAAARPIDPMRPSTPEAEEEAAFAAFVLTTLFDPPDPTEGEDETMLPTYDRYAGFTLIAPLPGGRLLAAVPDGCGAYQCVTIPFLLDPAAGRAVRAAVELPARGGGAVAEPALRPVGIVTVEQGVVTILNLGRGIGDCGIRSTYRAGAAALELLRVEEKAACDGAEWTPENTVVARVRGD